jgi:hypothetical protein
MLLPTNFSKQKISARSSNNSPCGTKALLQIRDRIRADERETLLRRQIPFDIAQAMQDVDREENTTLCQTLEIYLQQRSCPFCACSLSNHNTRCRTCGWRK